MGAFKDATIGFGGEEIDLAHEPQEADMRNPKVALKENKSILSVVVLPTGLAQIGRRIGRRVIVLPIARALCKPDTKPGLKDFILRKSPGLTDLLTHYRTQQTGIAAGDRDACIGGETLDGVHFQGCDRIQVLSACGLGFEAALVLPGLMWLRKTRRTQRVAKS